MKNLDTTNLTLVVSDHAARTILSKSLDPYAVRNTFTAPERTTEVTAHPGQVRLCGNGVALVGRVEGGRFFLITAYLDRVLTAPRADQMQTPEGRRFAARFGAGMGRG